MNANQTRPERFLIWRGQVTLCLGLIFVIKPLSKRNLETRVL